MGGSNKTDGLMLTKPKQDLTGKVFTKLTVLYQGPDLIQGGSRRAAWFCKCACGNPNKLLISGDSLKTGHTKSCGCIHRDYYEDNNKYDISGEYGICTMSDGNKFIFDIDDYNLIKKYNWHFSGRDYIGTTIYNKETKKHETLMIHRLLMNVQDLSWKEVVVDHINGNIYDNRKSNLRVVTQAQNSMNQKKSKNNTSGITGVYSQNNKWCSHIKVNGTDIFLGMFDNFNDAVKVRKIAEEKYFGEYSYDNSQRIGGDAISENLV